MLGLLGIEAGGTLAKIGIAVGIAAIVGGVLLFILWRMRRNAYKQGAGDAANKTQAETLESVARRQEIETAVERKNPNDVAGSIGATGGGLRRPRRDG